MPRIQDALHVAAAVSNGNKTDIVITHDMQLYLTEEINKSFHWSHLGPATKDRIDQIIYNLNQLRNMCP